MASYTDKSGLTLGLMFKGKAIEAISIITTTTEGNERRNHPDWIDGLVAYEGTYPELEICFTKEYADIVAFEKMQVELDPDLPVCRWYIRFADENMNSFHQIVANFCGGENGGDCENDIIFNLTGDEIAWFESELGIRKPKKAFTIHYGTRITCDFEVEANNEVEALEKAKEMVESGEVANFDMPEGFEWGEMDDYDIIDERPIASCSKIGADANCFIEELYWPLFDAYMSYQHPDTHDNIVETTPRSEAMDALAKAAEATSMYLCKIINEGEEFPDAIPAIGLLSIALKKVPENGFEKGTILYKTCADALNAILEKETGISCSKEEA